MSDTKQYSLKFFLTTCLYAAQRARSMTREREGSFELLTYTDPLLAGEGDESLVMGGLYRAINLFDLPEPPRVNMFTSVFTILQHSELLALSYFMRRSFVGNTETYEKAPVDLPTLVELMKMEWTDVGR